MYRRWVYLKPLFSAVMLCLFSSCAHTYLKHPFPEQPLNDKRYVDDRKDYAGSIDIKRKRVHLPFAGTRVYYNNRFIGRAGTRDSLRIYLDRGKYVTLNGRRHPVVDTVDLTNVAVVNLGHGPFLDPLMVVYKGRHKFYINTVDTLAAKNITHERESQ